jgi:parallel beta-helix repeat protein
MVNCEFSNGAFPGIYVQEGKCSIQNSRFRAMTQNGISLNKVTNFVIENSEFDEVQGSAIAIVDQSTGLIRNNRLQKIGGNSLYISGDSNVTIEGNVIEGGEYPAIAVLLSSSAVVRGNTVREMACSSVCIRGAKTAVIDQLTIVNSRECGISVSDSQSCVIENSIFQGCAFAGIECYNWSDVTVKHSTLRNCKIGFAVYAEGKLTAVENNAIGISDHLASLTFHGSAIISQTECTEVAALADVKTARLCVFQGNGTFPDCTNDQTKANELGIVFLQPWAEPAPKRCLKCNTANRDVFLMPCGHMIYCQSCAAAAKDASEVCPICRFPISAATPGFPAAGEDVCMICSEGAPTCMIVPCGHRGFCRACLDKWYKCHHFCPACRAEPSSFKEIITDL